MFRLRRYVDSFDAWKPWDCGIETDTGSHGVWACFSESPFDLSCHPGLTCVVSVTYADGTHPFTAFR